MPNWYDIGDVIRCSSTFTDTGGAKADPTTVKFVYSTPAGAISTDSRAGATTGEVNNITRLSTGSYFRDVVATASGPYWYRFSSTGAVTTSAEWNFQVRKRRTAV